MIGVSENVHPKLKRLKEDGHFREMLDAYRFGIAYALAMGVVPDEVSSQTVFSVASVDPDQTIKHAIQAILGDQVQCPVYRMAERLANWGVQEIYEEAAKGSIDMVSILDKMKAKSET
ncbi:MAG: hypothetical protein IPK20_00170 [Betaproteobacteria bacterium]|nr:hypothetical protein [Betaproteobacteria bacterium]